MLTPPTRFRPIVAAVALGALGVVGLLTAMRPQPLGEPAANAASDDIQASPGFVSGSVGAQALPGSPSPPPDLDFISALAVGPADTAPPVRISDAEPPYVTAYYVAIVDEGSGTLLYGDSPDVRTPPASVTKIATTLLALQREPDLSRVIPITVDGLAMAAADGSQVIGLAPGERLRLETLLHGIMLWSGNDAAEQVAVSLADGSQDRYVEWMNHLAAVLGLQNTHFANPSGMDADGHYSSAADMAYLARVAMRNPMFRKLAETRTWEAEGYVLANLNRLLGSYPGADGVKIGFTDNARRTMVGSATRDGHRVYVSIMRSEDLVGDETALLDWVWRTYRW